MKIIHVVHGHLNKNTRVRIASIVTQLAKEQHVQGLDVEIWAISYREEVLKIDNVQTRYYSSLKNKLFLTSEMKEALNLVTSSTLFHFHGGFYLDYFVLSKALVENKNQFVTTPYGAYNLSELTQGYLKKKMYFDFFEKLFLDRTSLVFCACEMEKEQLLSIKPGVRVDVLPNGYNLEDDDHLYLKTETPVFTYKGVLTEYSNGLDLLLLGFMKYRQWLKGTGKLRLIGQGFFENSVRALSKEHQLDEYIEIYNKKEDAQDVELLASSDALFMTSRSGGLSEELLEAASYGVPCVISKSATLIDYVIKYRSGIVLDKNTIDQIALAMKNIEHMKETSSGELLRYQVNAENMIEQEFNWKVVSMRMLNSYHTA